MAWFLLLQRYTFFLCESLIKTVPVTAISAHSGNAVVSRLSPNVSVRAPVLLVDTDHARGALLERELVSLGYPVLARIKDMSELLMHVERLRPAIVVVGVDMPDQAALANLATLHRKNPLPVVMFAEQNTPDVIQETVRAGVSACVVDDIQPERFISIINIAMARFEETQRLRNELEETKAKLADRKVIDRAKGVLMQERGLSENDAYATLRKMAMNKGLTLGAVAKTVLEIFAELGTAKKADVNVNQ